MPEYSWLQTCVGADYWEIHKMQDAGEEIDYDELVEAVGIDELRRFFPEYDWDQTGDGLTLKDDWSVTYHRSLYRGFPCMVVGHSGIDYIWIKEVEL